MDILVLNSSCPTMNKSLCVSQCLSPIPSLSLSHLVPHRPLWSHHYYTVLKTASASCEYFYLDSKSKGFLLVEFDGIRWMLDFKVVPTGWLFKQMENSGAGEMSLLDKVFVAQSMMGLTPGTQLEKWEWSCVLVTAALRRERREDP